MSTFIMFGKYSAEALKKMSPERTEKVVDLLRQFGGEVKSMYALLGQNDLLLIVDFPGIENAMKASVAVNKSTGISFNTSPAVSVDEFDRMMNE